MTAALDTCITKIETHQKKNGTWNYGGWAPVISTSFATQALYDAEEKGYTVDDKVLDRVKDWSKKQYDDSSGTFHSRKAAGVELYQGAMSMQALGRSEADRKENRKVLEAAGERLDSERFVRGFGSGGGEEYVSYMSVSATLKKMGGKKWRDWNDRIRKHLVKVQNEDGSWSGKHCITGRVAVTSAAVLTLTEPRTVPPEVTHPEGLFASAK